MSFGPNKIYSPISGIGLAVVADPPADQEQNGGSDHSFDAMEDEFNQQSGGDQNQNAVSDQPGEGDIIDPANPRENFQLVLQSSYSHPDRPTLTFDGSTFHKWDGTKYTKHAIQSLREKIYSRFENSKKIVVVGEIERTVEVKPNKTFTDNIVDAAKAASFIEANPTCWLIDRDDLSPVRDLIPAKNGLFRFNGRGLERVGACTPNLFNTHALDYDVLLNAKPPTAWLAFLESIWGDDAESIALFQEWAGYCVSADTSQQKMLLIVGPKRSGKGTLARVLTAMVGAANVCGPTLSGLASHFGLMQLVGKLVAIISDARLSGRTDQAVVTERLLAITGEDLIDIDQKNMALITQRLLVRFTILTNELPRLSDSSGALPSRFLILRLTESFIGREDTTLTDRLLQELPAILLWAIQGLVRLRQRGRFAMPDSSAEMLGEMEDLSSPIGAFIREWCKAGAAATVPCVDMFDAWCCWSREQGNSHPGTRQVFGRDLRAVFPAVRTTQAREGDGRVVRLYSGIRLTEAATATLAADRAKRGERGNHNA